MKKIFQMIKKSFIEMIQAFYADYQNLKNPKTQNEIKMKVNRLWKKAKPHLKSLQKEIEKGFRYMRRYPYQKTRRKLKNELENDTKMQIIIKYLIFLIFTCFVFFVITVMFEISDRGNNQKKLIEIPKNMPTRVVAHLLDQKQIISHPDNFLFLIKLFRLENQIHSGQYLLSPAMSHWRIIQTLREKNGISLSQQVSVTIQEGLTLKEIAEKLEAAQIVSSSVFIRQVENTHFEDYLFPDTYYFPKNSSSDLILEQFKKRFEEKIAPFKETIEKSGFTLRQILTLASIIELEAQLDSERKIISGVFHNRLKANMPLGSCPTVKFALNDIRKPFLLYKDLEIDSPYNTYKYVGLPPGPICSPGIASIEAALFPDEVSYYYFVAKGDGSHIFSNSNEEHIKAQQEILNQNSGKVF